VEPKTCTKLEVKRFVGGLGEDAAEREETRMALPPDLMAHPRELVLGAVATYGENTVIDWCLDLLTGRVDGERAFVDRDLPPLAWIGGRMAIGLARWSPERRAANLYWVRVWAARAFLYVWRDDVTEALIDALDDEAWRVHEHVARVTATRELGAVVDHLLPLLDHELPRVRAAAVRAIGVAGESEHVAPVRALRNDEEHAVRVAVERAVERLAVRLDRPVADLLDLNRAGPSRRKR
jgi:hypothetical protein